MKIDRDLGVQENNMVLLKLYTSINKMLMYSFIVIILFYWLQTAVLKEVPSIPKQQVSLLYPN